MKFVEVSEATLEASRVAKICHVELTGGDQHEVDVAEPLGCRVGEVLEGACLGHVELLGLDLRDRETTELLGRDLKAVAGPAREENRAQPPAGEGTQDRPGQIGATAEHDNRLWHAGDVVHALPPPRTRDSWRLGPLFS